MDKAEWNYDIIAREELITEHRALRAALEAAQAHNAATLQMLHVKCADHGCRYAAQTLALGAASQEIGRLRQALDYYADDSGRYGEVARAALTSAAGPEGER